MDEFKWIQMSSFVLLMLQFTAAATRQLVLHFTVRDGDQVSLPCNNMIDGQQECDSTIWIFSGLRNAAAVELIKLGQIAEQAKTKSDRLSVTKNCSLVIKKVSAEDAGRYTCRQYKSGQQQGPDSDVYLSVVTTAATRQLVLHFTVRDGDQVSLPCNNMIDGQQECDSTTWVFSGLRRDTGTVELVNLGQIGEQTRTKSDRLSVTKNCSLVIKKVSAEDAGRYTCRQFDKSGHQQGPDSQVDLSVVTTAATRQLVLHFTVRDGDQVSLPCNNMIDGQQECDSTTWLFNALRRDTAAVELIKLGQIGEQTKTNSDRLSVTKNCSLVIKKVSAEDAGRYTCRQYKSGQQQGPDSQVHLSVVTMTEREDADEVTLSCSVWTYGPCGHTVKWLFNRIDVDKENHQVKTSQSSCSASLTGLSSHFIYESRFDLLKCEVTDGDKVQFLFSPRPSGEDTTTTTTTTATTTNDITPAPGPLNIARTDRSVLDYMMLVLRVAELLLITLIAVLLIRAAGKQRPPDDNTVLH
uniref:uncharacterized protein LOC124050328 isoform X2 n=1 Tax=Scatophagus argus TaxID=75038 RepID=UPI001ED83DCA|nr:uncharacterized protein LOC124050328 isoform X2 [Scatophagus argus]